MDHRKTESPGGRRAPSNLNRALTFWPLLFYGLGVIIGAGIYVATGAVVVRAGETAPVSFLLAGAAAALTGLCYADLAARFPEAAGAAAYVKYGFGSDRLALLVGAATTLAVAIAAASIARGAISYLAELVPLPAPVLITLLIAGFTVVAASGVRTSVGLAAAAGLVEIGGLIAATIVGVVSAPELHFRQMVPSSLAAWQGTIAGAFIAFFAFVGFESLANMAEEVKDPTRTLPRGIIGAIVVSVVFYVAVATAAVLSDKGGANPLLSLFEGRSASLFAAVAGLSVANGVLVEIVMLARLFYGMARNGQLPAALELVNARTQTPMLATIVAGGIVLAAALLFPFEGLLVTTNALTLGVFVLVDLALWRIQRKALGSGSGFVAPQWVAPLGALVSFVLLIGELML